MQTEPQDHLPAGVGPHEGNEFDLMRAGHKNVALFFEIAPEGLDQMLKDGFMLLQFPQFEHLGETYFTRIVYRDGFGGDARRLKELLQTASRNFDPAREHEIGKILAYSTQEVEAFINHVRSKRTAQGE